MSKSILRGYVALFSQDKSADKNEAPAILNQTAITTWQQLKIHCLRLKLSRIKRSGFEPGVAIPRGVVNNFLEGSRIDVLCTQLYYICFIPVLDGSRWVIVGW